jgi:hypothetical protein
VGIAYTIIIGFIVGIIARFLYLGEPTSPPRLAPARSPPLWEIPDAGQGGFDPQAQPAPDYQFDQRFAW